MIGSVVLTDPQGRADAIGVGFDDGQYVQCEFGYADAHDSYGFPMPLSGSDTSVRMQVRGGADQWMYSMPEDSSAYLTVSARNPDGTVGEQCWGESKTSFNYEGKGGGGGKG